MDKDSPAIPTVRAEVSENVWRCFHCDAVIVLKGLLQSTEDAVQKRDARIAALTEMLQICSTDAQSALAAKDARIERLTELLKLVQTDAGNWLHAKLQDAIDIAAGPPGPYRSVRNSGLPLASIEAPGAPSGQACNHDLESPTKTLKATLAPRWGWQCTVCKQEWYPDPVSEG